MRRRLATLVVIGLLAGGVAAVGGRGGTSVPASRPAGTAAAPPEPLVAASTGNDTSPPLRELDGRTGGEAEREGRAGVGAMPSREAERERTFENLARRPKRLEAPQRDAALQPAPRAAAPLLPMPAPLLSFDGISAAQSGCGCVPPDANAEVGANDVVEMVNTAIAVYSKTGVLRAGFPKPINAIWSGFNAGPECRDNNDGDPIVLYDQLAGRWVISQFAIPGFINGSGINAECMAVSATSDPTGSWYRYQFPYTNGLLNDYPKLGVWPDAYYATFNSFSNTAPYPFAGAGVVAYDRAKMLAGQPATLVQFNIPPSANEGGLLPADLDGTLLPPAGAPAPIVQMQDSIMGFPNDRVMVRRFHVDFTTPANSTLSAPTVLLNAPFDSNLCNFSPCVPQPGTSSPRLDAISDRIMFRASYRNFGSRDSLLINATVDVNGADLAGIRWTELSGATTTSPAIVQQSTYSSGVLHRWMGSIAQDRSGNIALAYSASNTSTRPSLRYAGRLAGDPPNVLTQTETVMKAGGGSQTSAASRWGDYSDLSIDPTDDCTFWYANEYYPSTSVAAWRTRIGAFRFPGCTSVRSVAATWSAAEDARLQQIAGYLGMSAPDAQAASVSLLAYLIALSGDTTPTPVTLPAPGTEVTYLNGWAPAEQGIIDSAKAKYVLNDSDVTRLGVYFLSYLYALGGR